MGEKDTARPISEKKVNPKGNISKKIVSKKSSAKKKSTSAKAKTKIKKVITIKAAAEKAAAEKAAAEKAAAEKAAAEKAAAEKVAAEKAAAEKAAAEKAAAEKAAAEKAAAEKAVAEKAAAEKAAAEKAAAEKAAAEKAAAEKAAAEKAVAEKAAAEKAAAEKTAEIVLNSKKDFKSSVNISYENIVSPKYPVKNDTNNNRKKKSKPIKCKTKLFIASLATLIAIIIFASISNNSKYYFIEKNNNLEVWQGTFSPLGQKRLEVLYDAEISAKPDKNYSKKEIMPIVFGYYLNKADYMLNENIGIPDFENIRGLLLKALPYGLYTTENNSAINKRLNNIDRIVLLCKADIVASVKSANNLEHAITLLEEARELTDDLALKEVIMQKILFHKNIIASIEVKK